MDTEYYSLVTHDNSINLHFANAVQRAKFMLINELTDNCVLYTISKELVDKKQLLM